MESREQLPHQPIGFYLRLIGGFWVTLRTPASVGIYSIGYTIGIIGMMANSAVTAVWTPEAAKEYGKDPCQAKNTLGALAERLVAGYACVWLIVTAAGADVIRMLAAPAFHDAAVLVPFIAAGVLFYGISHLANASLLLVRRLDHAMWCWIVGSVVGLFLNFLLVPQFGRIGAALTQTITFALIARRDCLRAQKHYPLTLDWMRLAVLMVGTSSWVASCPSVG
ncbi:MAG: polysaccharide biosynthesis C-terminal domain-containing protein [Gammaproteobacteria bacterium]|nr:polysaccharide biosynthesis C-terminal domain-containing protein [Gammaproteobacteria bacterium]